MLCRPSHRALFTSFEGVAKTVLAFARLSRVGAKKKGMPS